MVRKIHKAWRLHVEHSSYQSAKDKLLTQFGAPATAEDHLLCCGCALCPSPEQKALVEDALAAPQPEGLDWGSIPCMPVRQYRPKPFEAFTGHRARIPEFDPMSHVAVARPVFSKEISREIDARKALDTEWKRLADAGTWDLDEPREAEWVRNLANKKKKTVHFGRVFEICVEKGSELPKGSKGRKYKVARSFKATG